MENINEAEIHNINGSRCWYQPTSPICLCNITIAKKIIIDDEVGYVDIHTHG